MQALTPAPTGVGAWAEKLREAAYDAVKETDVQDLMKSLMEKAKNGDLKAAKFVMEFLTGGAPKVQMQTVIVHKRSKSTQKQAKAPEPKPIPKALEGPPSIKVLRRLAAHFLGNNGPSPAGSIAKHLEIATDELEVVLECDWFMMSGGAWSLTPDGRRMV